MRHGTISLLAGVLALFGMSGCLEIDQVINLKEDGSGTITEELVMGPTVVKMLEDLPAGADADNPIADIYDVGKYRKLAANYGEGVKFSRMEKIERLGGKGVKVTYLFEDINRVKFVPGSTLNNLNEDERHELKDEPLSFEYAGGVLTVKVPNLAKGEGAGEGEVGKVADAAMEAMMARMIKGMKLSARLIVEPGIQESDASYLDGKTITFLNLNFDQILQNPNGLKALNILDGATRAELKEALKGVKGAKIETREKIRVKVGSQVIP